MTYSMWWLNCQDIQKYHGANIQVARYLWFPIPTLEESQEMLQVWRAKHMEMQAICQERAQRLVEMTYEWIQKSIGSQIEDTIVQLRAIGSEIASIHDIVSLLGKMETEQGDSAQVFMEGIDEIIERSKIPRERELWMRYLHLQKSYIRNGDILKREYMNSKDK